MGVLEEARFFGLTSVVEALEEAVAADVDPTGDSPFHRRDIVQALMTTSVVSELRFQGVNFSGADLSKLDLRHINFRFAKLVGADLRGANLAHCNLERADLTNANLDGEDQLDLVAIGFWKMCYSSDDLSCSTIASMCLLCD